MCCSADEQPILAVVMLLAQFELNISVLHAARSWFDRFEEATGPDVNAGTDCFHEDRFWILAL